MVSLQDARVTRIRSEVRLHTSPVKVRMRGFSAISRNPWRTRIPPELSRIKEARKTGHFGTLKGLDCIPSQVREELFYAPT